MSTMTPPRLSSRVAGWTAHVVLFGAVVLFALAVHAHYPIQHWLFWRYACYWLLAILFSFACLSAGCRIVAAVSRPLPVGKVGFNAQLAGWAAHDGPLYGLAAILLALGVGWLGGTVMRRF